MRKKCEKIRKKEEKRRKKGNKEKLYVETTGVNGVETPDPHRFSAETDRFLSEFLVSPIY